MRGLGNFFIGVLAVCLSPLVVIIFIILPWAGVGVSLYQWRKRVNVLKRAIPDLFCFIDTDCPPGYVCLEGHCVPKKA